MGGGTETRGTGKLGQIDTGPNIRTCRHKSSNLKRAYPLLPTPTRPVVESIFGNRKAVMAGGREDFEAGGQRPTVPISAREPVPFHLMNTQVCSSISQPRYVEQLEGEGVWRWASLCVITVRRCVMVVVNDTCSIRW